MTKRNETTEDFKARLAAMLRQPNEPIGGAQRSHPCRVRRPSDRGFYPPARRKATRCPVCDDTACETKSEACGK